MATTWYVHVSYVLLLARLVVSNKMCAEKAAQFAAQSQARAINLTLGAPLTSVMNSQKCGSSAR
jgi:hypothetical protein